MKLQLLIFGLIYSAKAFAQIESGDQPLPAVLISANDFDSFQRYTNATQMVSSCFVKEGRININIIVNVPKSCPVEFANVVSNTNLFSPAEQKLLAEIPLEYKSVTTNSGPPDSHFVGLDKTQWPFTERYGVAHFRYTNSGAEIRFFFVERHSVTETWISNHKQWIRFRTKSGDGYDVLFNDNGLIVGFRQFEHNQLNGLWADFGEGRCSAWMRFVNGKAVGKWLVWNRTGSLYMEAEFKEPYDFVRYLNFAQ